MDTVTADVAVIGGGASGLAAAVGLLESYNLDVVIAERLDRVGRKILATGNGRCNLSNRNITAKAYHGTVKNVMNIIENTPSAEEFFNDLGVLCVSDEQGRMYPVSNSAASVLSALRIRVDMLGGRELCGFEVKRIEGSFGDYSVYSDDSVIRCKAVIIAAGGYAAPSFGTDGGMTRILKEMGCRTAKICPAVAPLRVRPESVKGLKGVRVKGKIAAVSGGKVLREEYGEIQFTENSLSGICVFNLAYLFSEYEGRLTLRADLMPEMKSSKLESYLCMTQAMRYDCPLEELLTGIFVKNLAVYIMKKALGRSMNDTLSSVTYLEIREIAKIIKSLEFEVTGSSSWQNAQVTSGGIHGDYVNNELELKSHRGIYLCGEILDVDGDCGGYNLQWAWSSGLWAAENCAKLLKTEVFND